MSISFTCPECRAHIEVADEHAGLSGQCPRCQRVIDIPSPKKPMVASASATPAPPPREERPARRRPPIELDEPKRPQRFRPAPRQPSAPLWAWLIGILAALVATGLLISSFSVLVFYRPSEPSQKMPPIKQQPLQGQNVFQRVTMGRLDGDRASLQNGQFQVQSRLTVNDELDPRSGPGHELRRKAYRIHLLANRPYRIEMRSDQFATFLHVEGQNGHRQSMAGGQFTVMEFTPRWTGEHTIFPSSGNPALGDFTLTITER